LLVKVNFFEILVFIYFDLNFLKRIPQGINVPRSVNMTDELAKEILDKDANSGQKYGGIDIEEAKRFLQNERAYDKQLEKARIKRKHAVSFILLLFLLLM